jgi:putative transposase
MAGAAVVEPIAATGCHQGEENSNPALTLGKYPPLCDRVEGNIEETLTYYRLALPHHKHMKSTNMLERLNQELKRRTHAPRIFPNAESCLRLVRALAVETHEYWLEGTRYLAMDHLAEHKKEAARRAA